MFQMELANKSSLVSGTLQYLFTQFPMINLYGFSIHLYLESPKMQKKNCWSYSMPAFTRQLSRYPHLMPTSLLLSTPDTFTQVCVSEYWK